MNRIESILTEDDIQDIADVMFYSLSEADHQLKKYSAIVADYSLVPGYINDKVTMEQAMNCCKLFTGKVSHYQNLFAKLKLLGAE